MDIVELTPLTKFKMSLQDAYGTPEDVDYEAVAYPAQTIDVAREPVQIYAIGAGSCESDDVIEFAVLNRRPLFDFFIPKLRGWPTW